MVFVVFLLLSFATVSTILLLAQRLPSRPDLDAISREEYDAIFWRVIRDQFGFTEAQSATKLCDIQCTPIEKIRVIEELAEYYGFQVTEADLDRSGSLQDLCDRTWSRTQRMLVFGKQ